MRTGQGFSEAPATEHLPAKKDASPGHGDIADDSGRLGWHMRHAVKKKALVQVQWPCFKPMVVQDLHVLAPMISKICIADMQSFWTTAYNIWFLKPPVSPNLCILLAIKGCSTLIATDICPTNTTLRHIIRFINLESPKRWLYSAIRVLGHCGLAFGV